MPKYLVLYRTSVSPEEMMANATPEQAQAGMDAWMQWAGKADGAIVDLGSPLNSVATVGTADASGMPIAGFSILQGDSRDEVTEHLEGHPHFLTPGPASIEVLEFLPIPGM